MLSKLTSKSIISIQDLGLDEISTILNYANQLKSLPQDPFLKNHLMGSCFLSPRRAPASLLRQP